MPAIGIFAVFGGGNDNTLTPQKPLLQSHINIDFLKVTFSTTMEELIMTNKITYTQQGDYLLPDLKLPDQPKVEIGVWGKRHLRYIEKYHKIRYTNLLTSCKLTSYLADIDEQA